MTDNVKVDFYDAGAGDSIVITFPSGVIGIVDGHPSPTACRPPLEKIAEGRKVAFVCLTHPHVDHGAELVGLVRNHPEIAEFWHSVSKIPAFLDCMCKTKNFSSEFRNTVREVAQGQSNFVFDLFGASNRKMLKERTLHSDYRSQEIDGVKIHILAPAEDVTNAFVDTYFRRLNQPGAPLPDTNLLSIVLVLEFGNNTVLLGSDALNTAWHRIIERYRKLRIPKACILKVPHHGAKNAISFTGRRPTYFDLCASSPPVKAVILAGDMNHPHKDVYGLLRKKAETYCSANHPRASTGTNPLKLRIPGARAPSAGPVCNAAISFEFGGEGPVKVLAGLNCEKCPLSGV